MSITNVLANESMESTGPYPPAVTEELLPGSSWSSNPHPSDDTGGPPMEPAELSLEIVSLDIPNRTVSARVSLALSDEIVNHLHVNEASNRALLSKVNKAEWEQIRVGIGITTCLTSAPTRANCGTPVTTVPLGQLMGTNGAIQAGSFTSSPVTLPVSGSPNRFPSDVYRLAINDPEVSIPFGITLVRKSSDSTIYSFRIPVTVTLAIDPGLADHTVTAFESRQKDPRAIGLIIDRPPLEKVTIYLVALLPLLLGGIVAHVSLRRRLSAFDPAFAAGLIAVILTILPLRSVLVPGNLSSVGLTLVDDILITGILVIAAFLFAHYAMTVTQTPSGPDEQEGEQASSDAAQS
ncbi:hypothetical protein [Streptomyces canus]|uniref:hypothetical protein n=1 Tax=Streptomyces canus TaxID=58343 RepID=UPI002DDC857C|nr:hypothetical protein [Streptomyces canus]WSD86680.1 hypothetical protein OG925_21295 [Streptomyces canus]